MIFPMYAVRDVKTTFWSPQISQNREDAVRAFSQMVNSGTGLPAFAPSDFSLYKVGEFNSETGDVTGVTPIEYICSGNNVIGDRVNEK